MLSFYEPMSYIHVKNKHILVSLKVKGILFKKKSMQGIMSINQS